MTRIPQGDHQHDADEPGDLPAKPAAGHDREQRDPRCKEADCERPRYARDWCAMHYKRWLRQGTARREERRLECAVDGCERQAKSRGWCHAHYQRWRTHGEVQAHRPLRSSGPCSVASCERSRYARGLCQTHYRRLLKTGDPRPDEPIRVVTGQGWVDNGYWITTVPPQDRWLTAGRTQYQEHRLVMARMLQRPLAADEVVHHLNGDRMDNRPENLELWSTSHPSGQRLEDKVAWSIEMLSRYAPHLLRSRDGVKRDPRDR